MNITMLPVREQPKKEIYAIHELQSLRDTLKTIRKAGLACGIDALDAILITELHGVLMYIKNGYLDTVMDTAERKPANHK